MKRIVISMALALSASFAFAQQATVKEAQKAANSGDFAKAEQLINEALTNPETMNLAETWNVAGQIQKKKSAKQIENQVLRRPYDTLAVYTSALNMANYFFKCDELAQVPDEKGKIKNKYRNSNASAIVSERGNLVNGGIYFFNQQSEEAAPKAMEFFGAYVDQMSHPMLERENLAVRDTLWPTIAYYASLAALRAKNYDGVVKYASLIPENNENSETAAELVVTGLKEQGKTDEMLNVIKSAMVKYPSNQTFFANMIDYYSSNNNYDEALKFADEQIAKDRDNYFYYYVKGYLYSLMKQDANSVEYYKAATEKNPEFADAWANLARAYVLQAQDFSATASNNPNDPKFTEDQQKLKAFYEQALPFYEKAKTLAPDNVNLWKQGLSSCYYNLQMTDKYNALMNN